MKKQKTNKGITLIALIITIIVLLILAVVAINAVKGDGIMGHAKNAKEKYMLAQIDEQTKLNELYNTLNNYNSNDNTPQEDTNVEEVPMEDATVSITTEEGTTRYYSDISGAARILKDNENLLIIKGNLSGTLKISAKNATIRIENEDGNISGSLNIINNGQIKVVQRGSEALSLSIENNGIISIEECHYITKLINNGTDMSVINSILSNIVINSGDSVTIETSTIENDVDITGGTVSINNSVIKGKLTNNGGTVQLNSTEIEKNNIENKKGTITVDGIEI